MAQARLIDQGVGQHQGPARSHLHFRQGFEAFETSSGCARLAQQIIGVLVRHGQHHVVKTTVLGAIGADQLPALGMAFQELHLGLVVHTRGFFQGQCPMPHQGVHAGAGHKVWLAGGQGGFDDAAQRIEHPHGVGAPSAAHGLGAGHLGQGLQEVGIAHREVLGAVVKAAVGRVAAGHAPACAMAFLEDGDAMPGLEQGACGGDTGHTGPDDSSVFHGCTLHRCAALGLAGLPQQGQAGVRLAQLL